MTASATGPRRALADLRAQVLGLAVVCYVPLALGGRGLLNADTKQYLYLDPGDLLRRAPIVWDPHVAGGTVTHQNIGYLWPMGPWYWTADRLGLPDWLAQRLWIGSILFTASLGALVLLRHLLPRHGALVIAAAAYGLSPVVLGHVTGQSALLLPFSALPWLVWCLRRALSEGGWRWPAAIALLVTTAGSINGSSVFFVVVGAGLTVPVALWWERSVRWPAALLAVARTAVLTLGAQLWWMVAYAVGGAVGLPLLATTETVATTSDTASAAEVLRGLGYWFFYGSDASRPWLDGLATPYLQSPALIVITFAVPVLALLAAGGTRWPGRALATALLVTGTVFATVAFPEPARSPAGRLFESLSRHNDLVLSLRNTERAGPLVALGVALLLGAALTALRDRDRALGAGGAVLVAVVVAASVPALWRTGYVAARFHRSEALPAHWLEAAAHLREGEGRVLELPGSDFAAYRWGNTLDPVTPGLIDRPFVARELVPMGSRAGVALLGALDRGIQEGWFEPSSLAPVARLLGISELVVRSDLEYERYRIARPARVWSWLHDAPGLSHWAGFGRNVPNVADPRRPMIDEIELGLDPDAEQPPAVASATVDGGGAAELRALPAGTATVLAGDGEGIVAAAAAGLIDGNGLVLLSPDLTRDLSTVTAGLGSGTRVVITDSNRKRTERWYSMRENVGATEPEGAGVVDDTAGVAAIPTVEDQRPDAQSISVLRGATAVRASAYGNPFTLSPEDRPAFAFDGDPRTAWRVDTELLAGPHWIRVDLAQASSADHLVLHPPVARPGTRTIERAEVVLDGTRRFTAGPVDGDGVRVELDGRPFRRVEVRLASVGPDAGPAGFSEITIPGVTVEEAIATPTDVLDVLAALGARLDDTPVALVLSRQRADAAEPVRADPEPSIRRIIRLPGGAHLSITGTARLSARAPDQVLDQVLGLPASGAGWVRATSSERLPGSIAARASAALDGDPTTAWSTPLVGVEGQWWQVELARATRLRQLDLQIVSDAHHSQPRTLRVSVDGSAPVEVPVPPVAVGPLGTARSVTVPLPSVLTGRSVRIQVGAIAARTTPDWYTGDPVVLPVAVAEVALPGVRPSAAPTALDTGCRRDLVAVDETPVPVRARGSVADATGAAGIAVTACDGPVALAGADHLVTTELGRDLGIDVDRLVARTAAWDTARRAPAPAGPTVDLRASSSTRASATVHSDGRPFWLALDQSHNAGWHLDAPGATVTGPLILQGWSTGWLVEPDDPGPLTITATWTPQRAVWVGLALSVATVLVCVALVLLGWRRARRAPQTGGPPPRPVLGAPSPGERRPLAVMGWALVAALVLHPLAAPALLLLGGVALRWPQLQRWLLLVPAGLGACAGGLVVGRQVLRPLEIDAGWVTNQAAAHVVAALAVLSLALLVHLERPSPERTGPVDTAPEP